MVVFTPILVNSLGNTMGILHVRILLFWIEVEKEKNVVCCVGRVEIQIEIQKGRCTANTDSVV